MNMLLERKFQAAAKNVSNLTSKPSNDILLTLYAFYKQATEGDVNHPKPYTKGMKAMAKWDSWNKIKGTSSENSKKEYVKIVDGLLS